MPGLGLLERPVAALYDTRGALDRADRTCREGTIATRGPATRPVSARPTTGRIVPVVAFVAGPMSLSIGGRRRRDSTPRFGLPSGASGMGTRIFGRWPRARVRARVRGVTLCPKMYTFVRHSSVDGRMGKSTARCVTFCALSPSPTDPSRAQDRRVQATARALLPACF